MTARTPTYLKGRFENNDIPQATDYEDVFDSFVNFAVTAEQRMDGKLYSPELNTAVVSALSINAVNALITARLDVTSVSAATVSAANVYVAQKMFFSSTALNAVATTQGSTVALNDGISFIVSADNNNNSVRLPTSERGRIQHIINASTTAVKIFPAVSALFITTALNTPLSVAVNGRMIVYHQGNDRYASIVGA